MQENYKFTNASMDRNIELVLIYQTFQVIMLVTEKSFTKIVTILIN